MVVNKRNRWWETMDIFFLTMDGYPMTLVLDGLWWASVQEAIKSVIKRLANPSGVRRLHPHLLIHSYAPCGPQGTLLLGRRADLAWRGGRRTMASVLASYSLWDDAPGVTVE